MKYSSGFINEKKETMLDDHLINHILSYIGPTPSAQAMFGFVQTYREYETMRGCSFYLHVIKIEFLREVQDSGTIHVSSTEELLYVMSKMRRLKMNKRFK